MITLNCKMFPILIRYKRITQFGTFLHLPVRGSGQDMYPCPPVPLFWRNFCCFRWEIGATCPLCFITNSARWHASEFYRLKLDCPSFVGRLMINFPPPMVGAVESLDSLLRTELRPRDRTASVIPYTLRIVDGSFDGSDEEGGLWAGQQQLVPPRRAVWVGPCWGGSQRGDWAPHLSSCNSCNFQLSFFWLIFLKKINLFN